MIHGDAETLLTRCVRVLSESDGKLSAAGVLSISARVDQDGIVRISCDPSTDDRVGRVVRESLGPLDGWLHDAEPGRPDALVVWPLDVALKRLTATSARLVDLSERFFDASLESEGLAVYPRYPFPPDGSRGWTRVTGLEANLLLHVLELYEESLKQGRPPVPGYEMLDLGPLTDRLFRAHEHPPEEDEIREGSRFRVIRTDDHGNRFVLRDLLTREEAHGLASEMEARGHKQSFDVEDAGPRPGA